MKFNISLISLIFALSFSSNASAWQVSYCTAYLLSATQELKCQGHYAGTSSLIDMYDNGWELVTDLSGSHGFILIFEKKGNAKRANKASDVKSTLTITPDPKDARVRIMNIKDKYRDGIALSSGKYHILVDKVGFETSSQWVVIKNGEHKKISVQLKPKAN